MNTEAILRRLIAVQSDSGTEMECDIAREILNIIGSDDYFKSNPEFYGAWDGGDPLGRPVVWALKKGSARATLVLSGHYDAVGTENYGALACVACDPDALLDAIKSSPDSDSAARKDAQSGQWLFGRGSNDMKGGLAVNLKTLFGYAPHQLNILVTAVSDEENLSAGARQATALYRELAERFDLEYVFGVLSEPNTRRIEAGEPYPLINGSTGKIMPVVVARGHLAHATRSMDGLNSATLITRIIDLIELNPDLIFRDKGINTNPPIVQIMRDMKVRYDVSMPEYSAAAFNLVFLQGNSPLDMLESIRDICLAGLEQAVEKYRVVYKHMAAEAMLPAECMLEFTPAVYLCKEVEILATKNPGYESFHKSLIEKLETAVGQGQDTLQNATMKYLQALMDFTALPSCTAVVGIAPPFYPAANNDYLGSKAQEIASRLIEALKEQGLDAKVLPYTKGMTDLSYMSCADPEGAETVMRNIPLRGKFYNVDFHDIAHTGFPTMMIGPGGKCIHQAGERVYLPDVNEHFPMILAQLIALLDRDAGGM